MPFSRYHKQHHHEKNQSESAERPAHGISARQIDFAEGHQDERVEMEQQNRNQQDDQKSQCPGNGQSGRSNAAIHQTFAVEKGVIEIRLRWL